jgi:hypothetical protein
MPARASTTQEIGIPLGVGPVTHVTNGLKLDRMSGLTLLDASAGTGDALAGGESLAGQRLACNRRQRLLPHAGRRSGEDRLVATARQPAGIQPRTDDVRRAIGIISKGVRHVAGP